MSENANSKFETSKWSDFVEKCKNRAKEDNKTWPSAYYPSAEICSKPKYCLIAMEPGTATSPIEAYPEDVRKGRRIFFPSVVTYCAWRYLCEKEFDYQITDTVKSTKGCELTPQEKREQRETWLPLLKEELKLLGNPKNIIIGRELYKWLSKKGVRTDYILHYSGANNGNIYDEYERIKNKITDDIPTIREIEDFARKYMMEFGRKFGDKYYTDAKINKIIEIDETLVADRRDRSILSIRNQKLLAVYRYKFTCIRKGVED